MRRALALLVAALFLLTSCSSNLTPANIEAALVQDGDLPTDWEAGETTSAPVENGVISTFRDISGSGGRKGLVGTLVHERGAPPSVFAMLAVFQTTGAKDVEGFVEGAQGTNSMIAWVQGKCAAGVSLPGETQGVVLAYARRLDERLRGLGC